MINNMCHKEITIMDIIKEPNKTDQVNEMIKYVMNVRKYCEQKYGATYDVDVAQIGKRKRNFNKSNNHGKDYEEYIKDYFKSNKLPYYMNVNVKKENKDSFCELDFVIPGGVIEVKNVIYGEKTVAALYDLVCQLDRIIKIIPDDFSMFLIINPNIADVKYVQYVLNNSVLYDLSTVQLVTDPSQITFAPYEYWIDKRKHLDRYASLLNTTHNSDVNLLKNKTSVLKEIYDSLYIYMTHDEEEQLKEYNMKVISEEELREQNKFVVLFGGACFNLNSIKVEQVNGKHILTSSTVLYNFRGYMDPLGLSNKFRGPFKHNPKFTIMCEFCDTINKDRELYVICYKCKKSIK